MDSSQYIKRLKARVVYASHLARQKKIQDGCAARNIMGTASATSTPPILTELIIGERMLSQVEHDNVLVQNRCRSGFEAAAVLSVLFEPFNFLASMSFQGNVVSGSSIIERGVVWNTTGTPTVDDNKEIDPAATLGSYTIVFNAMDPGDVYARAYVISQGNVVAYGDQLVAEAQICLAAGTLVLLASGVMKVIEDITYDDVLCVWNFDAGCFDEAKPLWIKERETAGAYNLLEFSDGSQLKTINQHRIFDVDCGKFVAVSSIDAAVGPVGMQTFNATGELVTLVKKSVVYEPVDYYNIITDKHINMFTEGILTSCRYNNIYPIIDMKFVKEDRPLVENNGLIPDKYFEGMRLAEQTIPLDYSVAYIKRLVRHEV